MKVENHCLGGKTSLEGLCGWGVLEVKELPLLPVHTLFLNCRCLVI